MCCVCQSCGEELLVPLSCQWPKLLPIVLRAEDGDTAAHLVDRVLPFAFHRHYPEIANVAQPSLRGGRRASGFSA